VGEFFDLTQDAAWKDKRPGEFAALSATPQT